MERIDEAFPVQPQLPRLLRIEVVLNFESHVAREMLCAMADQQMVIGVLHDRFRHQRGIANALQRCNAAGLFSRSMHAAGIELHYAIGIRQPAVANTRVLRIQFDDIDAGNQGIEDILAFGHALECCLDAGQFATIFHRDAVLGRNDHRPDPGPDLAGRRLCRGSNRCCGCDSGCGTRNDEITSADLLAHFVPR